MLTIKHRFTQQLTTDFERLSNEKSERSTDVPPVERKSSTKPKKIDQLDDEELLRQVKLIEQENKNIRLENLLFSRYLQRINTSKIVDTYEEYKNDGTDIETFDQTSLQTKSSDVTRRFSIKKSSGNTTKGTPVWTKLSYNSRDHMYAPNILRVEQERLSMASYEADQTRLEWERMQTNASLKLDQLDILSQMAESDENAQEALNRQLEQTIDKHRVDIYEEGYDNSHLTFPAERVMNYINKQIKSRISLIGLLRFNTTRLRMHIQDVNGKLRSFDEFTDEVDVSLISARKLVNADTYKTLDRKYKIKKSSQYPLFRRLQEWKKVLHEQEMNINDMNRKCELLQNHYERTIIEIDCFKEECELILKENTILKNRIDDIKKVPTITDYAHIIEQTKILQHGIDIWTKRVNIAETLLSQLKSQNKPPHILPPLKLITHGQYQSVE